MRVMGLDPATAMGWCEGDPAERSIVSGSVRLRVKSEPVDVAPFNALAFLRDQWDKVGPPDLVGVERYMDPVVQKSNDAVVLQIMVYGAIVATCQAYGVPYYAPTRTEILKHFVGQTNFRGDYDAVKKAVLDRCKLVRLLPPDCFDHNRADAIAAWDWTVGYVKLRSKTHESLNLFR